MQNPSTNSEAVERRSMSARASMTRAEVTRIDEASLSQMRTRLERWGGQLSILQATPPPLGDDSGDEIPECINSLKAKYQIACVWFDEFKGAGPARWGGFRFCIQSAWSDFETALERLRSRVLPKDQSKGDER